MKGKIVILSAPSGTGKSSLIKYLMEKRPDLRLRFSISATSRQPREGEEHGREYYFISPKEFRQKIECGEFVEWEEVYEGTFYGTPGSEVERVAAKGDTLIMDIDVKGGMNVKEKFGNKALSIFVMPPSIKELERRLTGRATDSKDVIAKRLAKAGYELTFAKNFDHVVVNNEFEKAAEEIADLIDKFNS